MSETLAAFFRRVTRLEILPYQERYGADPVAPTLLIIPTGLGKTDAVLLPWLHGINAGIGSAPRRLVFVLPRRNLTEQTARVARERVAAANLKEKIDVIEIMGGSKDNTAALSPDRHTIIVGTQDMVISRALNRGYARPPHRWPIDFALLNNDALWIIDELQLCADSLATSTQLAAFRERYGIFGTVPCVWMSATVDPAWLDSVDFRAFRPKLRVIGLEIDDYKNPIVHRRVYAKKAVAQAPEACRLPEGCAEFALSHHKSGERTLIIVNTVRRAREIVLELRQRNCEPVLLHSRFRPADRLKHIHALNNYPGEGQVVVSTQVLEAGIDISAHRLITDVAPWGSLVQRFGRVNRYGENGKAQIWWVDRPQSVKRRSLARAPDLKLKGFEEIYQPYSLDDIQRSTARLSELLSGAPADLPPEDGLAPWQYVLRKADLLDLFDTAPDISGNQLDISRFIRAGEDKDCYLAWRTWKNETELESLPDIQDDELCPVQIGDVTTFAKTRDLMSWDFVDQHWVKVDPKRLWPGMIILVQASSGGYTEEEGWNIDSKKPVPTIAPGLKSTPEGDGDDPLSWVSYRQTLADHTCMVIEELRNILKSLGLIELRAFHEDLELAAGKHDWGKAHPVMQATLHNVDQPDFADPAFEFLAKQKRSDAARKHKRPHFRHELASALAMLMVGDSDLAAYLAGAHHGRVRMSIRSMPGERDLDGAAIARGIQAGDLLPTCELAPGLRVSEVGLSLDVMGIGLGEGDRAAWTDRILRLRDELGPFRLAYLEMLLRTADERASQKKAEEVAACAP